MNGLHPGQNLYVRMSHNNQKPHYEKHVAKRHRDQPSLTALDMQSPSKDNYHYQLGEYCQSFITLYVQARVLI